MAYPLLEKHIVQEKEKILVIKNHFLDSNIHEEAAAQRQSTPAISNQTATRQPAPQAMLFLLQ